jgi:DNA-binding transcriptional MerR regulator/methylmalonyl-CoA mutase cobalamin-binding subunit
MKLNPTYTMKYVAHQTGLKPYLIRTWESRYNAVCPQRSENNRRCFTDDDIRRLALLKKAVDAGHSISSVASLSTEELDQMIGQRFRIAGGDGITPPHSSSSELDWEAQAARFVEVALSHTIQIEPTRLEKVLNEAAVDLPRQTFLQSVILLFFERIGVLWRAGRLKAIHEHMASVIVRAILWEMLRSVETAETAPLLVVATPAGHWHEFGALASALAAAESGWRVAYFGPNLPADEIAYAVKKTGAKAVALSLCHSIDQERVVLELKKLRRLVGDSLPIFIGGAGAMTIRRAMDRINTYIGMRLIEFRDKLESLSVGEKIRKNNI